MVTEDIGFSLPFISITLTLIFAIYYFYKDRTTKSHKEGVKEGAMSAKLDQIFSLLTTFSDKLTKIESNHEATSRKVYELELRVAEIERTKKRKTKIDADE